jgi:hypothetical protein
MDTDIMLDGREAQISVEKYFRDYRTIKVGTGKRPKPDEIQYD